MAHSIVLLTSLSTNTWNAVPGDIVECESVEEKTRLLAVEYGRELESEEPTKTQKVYRMADAHAPVVVPEVAKPTKAKKAANADDTEFDESNQQGNPASTTIAPKKRTASKATAKAE